MTLQPLPGWRAAGHFAADPPPTDWREALAARLGRRPRRLGLWAELALYGARHALDAAGLAAMPAGAALRVMSLSGSESATHATVQQCRTDLPMPFGFLQSQPSQMIAALGQYLDWQGDGNFMLSRDPVPAWQLAQREAGPAGLLFGRVEEHEFHLATEWWWLVPSLGG